MRYKIKNSPFVFEIIDIIDEKTNTFKVRWSGINSNRTLKITTETFSEDTVLLISPPLNPPLPITDRRGR